MSKSLIFNNYDRIKYDYENTYNVNRAHCTSSYSGKKKY